MRSGLKLVLAVAAVTMLFAAPAEAKVYELGKFKILSVSGSREITFTENGTTYSGDPCAGTMSARMNFRSTGGPLTVYMNVRRIHGRRKVVVSDKPKPPQRQTQQMEGEATVSRTASYEATAGCNFEPADCPETTAPANLIVFGTDNHEGGVGVEPSSGFGAGTDCSVPTGPAFTNFDFEQTAYADVFSWTELFDGKGKRLEGTKRIEEAVTGDPEDPRYVVSGTRTDETTIVMKRLKLEEDLHYRR